MSGYRLEGFLEGLERERRKVRERLGDGRRRLRRHRARRPRAADRQEEAAGRRMKRRLASGRSCSAWPRPLGGARPRTSVQDLGRRQADAPRPFYRKYLVAGQSARRQDRRTGEAASRSLRTTRTCTTISETCSRCAAFPRRPPSSTSWRCSSTRRTSSRPTTSASLRETEGKLSRRDLGVQEVDHAQARLSAVALSPRPALRARPDKLGRRRRAVRRRRSGSIPRMRDRQAQSARHRLGADLPRLARQLPARHRAWRRSTTRTPYFDEEPLPASSRRSRDLRRGGRARARPGAGAARRRRRDRQARRRAPGAAEPPARRGQRAPRRAAADAAAAAPSRAPAPRGPRPGRRPGDVPPRPPREPPRPRRLAPETVEPPPEAAPRRRRPNRAPEPPTPPARERSSRLTVADPYSKLARSTQDRRRPRGKGIGKNCRSRRERPRCGAAAPRCGPAHARPATGPCAPARRRSRRR